MEGGLFPRRRPLSPLEGGYMEEEVDEETAKLDEETQKRIDASKERYKEYTEKLNKVAREKFEKAYRDWDLPRPNDPRTPTPRWEMTEEEELHWRSLMKRGFEIDEKCEESAATSESVPDKPVDPNNLPRRYRKPDFFLSNGQVDENTEEELEYTQLIRKQDKRGILKSFRSMYETENDKPRTASEKRRGYDEAFYDERSQDVLSDVQPKKIKENPREPTKGIEKEWIASNSDKFKKAYSERSEIRSQFAKSRSNVSQKSSSARSGVPGEPKEQEIKVPREPDPTLEETNDRIRGWLKTVEEPGPEESRELIDYKLFHRTPLNSTERVQHLCFHLPEGVMLTEEELEKGEYFYNLNQVKELRKIEDVDVEMESEEPENDLVVESVRMMDVDLEKSANSEKSMEPSEIGENEDGSESIDYEAQYLLYQQQRRKQRKRTHRSVEVIQRSLLKVKQLEQEVNTHLLEQWFDWQESKKARPTKEQILEEQYDIYLQTHCEEFDTSPMDYKDYEKFFDEEIEKERSRHPKRMTWQEAEDDKVNNSFFEFKSGYDKSFAEKKLKLEKALHRAKERIRIPRVKAEMQIVEDELIATAEKLNEDKWNGDGDTDEWDQRYLKYIYGSDDPIERMPCMEPPKKETFKQKVLRIAERRMWQREIEVICEEKSRFWSIKKEEQDRRDAEYKREVEEEKRRMLAAGEKRKPPRDPEEVAYEALTDEDKKDMNILRLDEKDVDATFPAPCQAWVKPEGPIPILGPEVPRFIIYNERDLPKKPRGRGKKGARAAPKRGAKMETIGEEGEDGEPIFKVPAPPFFVPPAEIPAPKPEPEIQLPERKLEEWLELDLPETDSRHPNYMDPALLEAARKEYGVTLLPGGRRPIPEDELGMPKGKSEYQLYMERKAERKRREELMEYDSYYEENIVDDNVPASPEFQNESSPISEKRMSRTPSLLRDEELNEPAAPEHQYTADELLGDSEENVVAEEEDANGDSGLLEDTFAPVEEPILVEPETDSVMIPEEEAAMEYGILEKSDEALKVETPPKTRSKKRASVKKSVSVETPLDEDVLLDGAFNGTEDLQEIDEAALLDKEPENNFVIPEQESYALLDDPNLIEPEFAAPDFQYEDLEKEYGQPEKEATPAPASFKPIEEPTVVEPTPEAPRKRGRPKKRVPPQPAVGTVAKKPAPEREETPEQPKEEQKKPAAGKRARKPEETPEVVTGPRTKRTYVSKNNPLPRVRDFVEPVAPADKEPERLTGVAGACRAGSPGGTPEKLKHMSAAMRKLVEVDREESVVPQENVPIPEDEIKQEDQWVIPPPITESSRQSKKRIREELNQQILDEIKEENEEMNRDNGFIVTFAQIIPPVVKIEDNPELVVVGANFNQEITKLEPETLPVKRIDPKGKEHPTHMWLITHKMWEGVNELFMTDPDKFSRLMMILVVDTRRRGNVFRYDVTVVNRVSEFTPQFMEYLTKCSKTLTIEQEESMEYNTFFRRYREKATAFLGDHHISAYMLHQVVENIKTVKNAIREDCPAGILRENERDALAACERILIGQYIDSIMQMAYLSQVKWASHSHVKRRMEMIYHGWKMFLCTGGFFRLLLAIQMDKPISDVFRKYCQEYVEEIDVLYNRAIEIYMKTDEEVLKDMEETSGITAADIAKVDADIQVKKSDTHTHRCSTCLIRSQDAYFSSSALLDIHEKIHTSDMEECGKCFSDLLVPELVMHRIITHYSMRVQDDY